MAKVQVHLLVHMHDQGAHCLGYLCWGSWALLQPQVMKQLLLLVKFAEATTEANRGFLGWPE